jgi:hypothetical protein
MDNDLNLRTVTGQRLIDTIIDNLPYEMVKAFTASRTDIHPWTFANCFQTFEDLYLTLIVRILLIQLLTTPLIPVRLGCF